MAWDNADIIFPQGVVVTPDNMIVDVETLRNSNLEVITSLRNYNARKMIYRQDEWAWGKNGEFAIGTRFDTLNAIPHIENTSPLSVYGMAMLLDYINLNNITLFDEDYELSKKNISIEEEQCQCNCG